MRGRFVISKSVASRKASKVLYFASASFRLRFLFETCEADMDVWLMDLCMSIRALVLV